MSSDYDDELAELHRQLAEKEAELETLRVDNLHRQLAEAKEKIKALKAQSGAEQPPHLQQEERPSGSGISRSQQLW